MAAPFPSPTTTWHSTTYSSLSPLRPELSVKGKTVIITGDDKVDILVSGAAVVGPLEPIEHVNSDTFMDAIHTNIAGSLFVAQAFLRHASPNAIVVEINSSAAHINFSPGFSAYSVGKLAVCRLWDSLAFANPEMSVFHLQPGIVDTAMNREAGGIDAIGFSDDGELKG
ncbi:oxidoreductase [Aureobasidium pullulans]|nr:oxidoreductase [Aureobasidium pullulans]